MSNYADARFMDSQGRPKDPMATGISMMGPLPKTNNSVFIEDPNLEFPFDGVKSNPIDWQPPSMCVIKREPLPIQ